MAFQDYLEEHGVDAYLGDAVANLLELRPAKPLPYLAQYFENVQKEQCVVFRHFAFVNSSKHNRRMFISRFRSTFSAFGDDATVSLASFHQLLCLLCPDFPFSLVRNASRITVELDSVTDEEVFVQFGPFAQKLFTLFYFSEFMNQCALAFRGLDTDGSGFVDTSEFLDKLDEAVQANQKRMACPSVNAIHEVLLPESAGGSCPESESSQVMFNAFCVRLFQHEDLARALVRPKSYEEVKQALGQLIGAVS